ncbi:protein phosphatase CheZ [Acanthopleuribacter pedis]|uniref:Protein phosphatase CheZ n=1 Tax=Acanthopleuribacter pedis TaxID=442870 RepID=A0A8J7PY99_9BACT|nr:protein phosphatase CheZ [Acanthopleuribacter pedis]MBO1316867.1 protein phosphatase CheZ [Acanthopleuribacter pedis]
MTKDQTDPQKPNSQNGDNSPELIEPHLKNIVSTVKNLTEGNYHQEVEVDATGLIGELAYYINTTMKNLRTLDKNLGENVEDTPRAMSEVKAVIDHTEKATILVLDKTDEILANIHKNRDLYRELAAAKTDSDREKAKGKLETNSSELERSAYDIINAMEFQDVTQQKIMSIMSCLEGIEERLIDLLIIFKIKESRENNEENVEMLKHLHDEEIEASNKQGLVDQLLAEFGI